MNEAAQAVLSGNAAWPTEILADLYAPRTTPPNLTAARTTLDRAVDACYRSQPFPDKRRRFKHLFERYEALVAPLKGDAR